MKKIYLIPVCFLFLSISAQASIIDFPSGQLAVEPAIFEYAIYIVEPLKESPQQLAVNILKNKYPNFKLLVEKPDPNNNSIRIRVNNKAQLEYRPPDIESLRYSGKGVTKDQTEKLQKTNTVIIIDFAIPLANRISGLYEASKFIADLSKATNGIIWDEETRECFGYSNWVSNRVDSFENGIPDVSKHITIHAYKDGEFIRAITLGMTKFGLPDIEVSDFSWSDNRNIGNLINLFAQQIYEIGVIRETGKFSLNIDKIKHNTINKKTKESLYEEAEKEIPIHIVKGTRDEGDPNNRIIEIIFDNYPGKDKQEKMEAMLSKLWGWKDELIKVKHNEAIMAASERAKRELPSIKKKIRKGLAPGEYYMFKAPFITPDGGNEWMWVEVILWKNKNEIIGILKNQPFNIPSLKAGSKVVVKMNDIFDYIHRLPDGTTEGNETGELIQKYSQ